jgi:predicted PurR-regulated permease PerM
MPAFDVRTHARTARASARIAGGALLNWWRAVSIEALCVALLWWIGLMLLHVPLAPVWALIGGLMTFIPNFGGVITVIFPVLMVLFSGHDLYRLGFVLGLYALIVVIDQLLLQPMLLKRVTRVPIWASILVPILLGIIIPFWGVLLAPPLLAIVYAFRKPKTIPQAPLQARLPADQRPPDQKEAVILSGRSGVEEPVLSAAEGTHTEGAKTPPETTPPA